MEYHPIMSWQAGSIPASIEEAYFRRRAWCCLIALPALSGIAYGVIERDWSALTAGLVALESIIVSLALLWTRLTPLGRRLASYKEEHRFFLRLRSKWLRCLPLRVVWVGPPGVRADVMLTWETPWGLESTFLPYMTYKAWADPKDSPAYVIFDDARCLSDGRIVWGLPTRARGPARVPC